MATKERCCCHCKQMLPASAFEPRKRTCNACVEKQAEARAELIQEIGQSAFDRKLPEFKRLGIKRVRLSYPLDFGCECEWCQAHPDGTVMNVEDVPKVYPCKHPYTAGLLLLPLFDDEEDNFGWEPSAEPSHHTEAKPSFLSRVAAWLRGY